MVLVTQMQAKKHTSQESPAAEISSFKGSMLESDMEESKTQQRTTLKFHFYSIYIFIVVESVVCKAACNIIKAAII